MASLLWPRLPYFPVDIIVECGLWRPRPRANGLGVEVSLVAALSVMNGHTVTVHISHVKKSLSFGFTEGGASLSLFIYRHRNEEAEPPVQSPFAMLGTAEQEEYCARRIKAALLADILSRH